MSIINRVSQKTVPVETFNRFSANFNNPVGQYGFGQVAGNARQTVIEMREQYWYYIDRVSFSASIDEGVYLRSIATQPEIFFQFLKAAYRVYPRPLPCVNYKDNLEWCFWFNSDQGSDELLVTMDGVLNQVAETVGVATIYAQLSLVIYEVSDLAMIDALRHASISEIRRFYSGGVSYRG